MSGAISVGRVCGRRAISYQSMIVGLLAWLALHPAIACGASPTLSEASGSPFAANHGPMAAPLGDVNGDGHLDVVTQNYDTNTFSIFLGNGLGGFTASPHSPVSSGHSWQSVFLGFQNMRVDLSDLDKDGDLDIVSSGDQGVIVLLNNGSGQFTPATGSPFDAGASSFKEVRHVFVDDMNSDSRPDIIAVTGINGTYISILLSNGEGGFNVSSGYPMQVPKQVHEGDMGDFNGDGTPDLAVGCYSGNMDPTVPTVYVFLGNGIGGLEAAPGSPIVTGDSAENLVTADLNGDGFDDIVTASWNGTASPDPNSGNLFRRLLSDGKGRFDMQIGPQCNTVWAMASGDVNGDGMPDVVTFDSGWFKRLRICLGDGSGGLAEATTSPVDGTDYDKLFNRIRIGDVNGDGKGDIVVSHMLFQQMPPRVNKVTVLVNTTTGAFAPMLEPPFLAGASVGTAFQYKMRASGTTPITYGTGALPGWLSLVGDTLSGTPAQAGQTSVTLTAGNAAGSDTNTLVITVTDPANPNHPPVITDGPNAVPDRAGIGVSIAFLATASDDDGDPLAYLWSFGDGAHATAANPSHAFSAEGEFLVSVRVTDGKGGSVTRTVSVTVSEARPGDLNGDGVVNVDDVTLVTSHWGMMPANPNWDERADANGDGTVGDADLTIVKNSFGVKYE